MSVATRSLIAFLAFASFAASPFSGAFAQTVGVAPAQAPRYPAGAEESPTPLDGLVSGCMGRLFDAGLVTTDAREARIPASEWESQSFGLDAAREGRVDFIVALFADWKPSAFKKGAWILSALRYRLVRVADGATLASGSLEGPVDSELVAKAADRSAALAGADAATACLALLAPVSPGGK